MERFRRKSAHVEAMQLTIEVFDAEHPSDLHLNGVVYDPYRCTARVVGLDDPPLAGVGDWLVRGENGALSIYTPADFGATYEKATPEPPDEPKEE